MMLFLFSSVTPAKAGAPLDHKHRSLNQSGIAAFAGMTGFVACVTTSKIENPA
jgi:hypothetical protein